MNERVELKCKEYEFSLTCVETGSKVTVTLAEEVGRWKVVAKQYHGYFKDLETAFDEACRHLKYKTRKANEEKS